MDSENRRRLRELVDRQQIEDVMSRYAHGVDRHDVDLIADVYHPDAKDWHGPFRGDVPGFVEWVNTLHSGKTRAHTHNISTHWSEVNGDEAWTETYVLFALFLRDRDIVMLGSGRYIDRLERREDRWRIADRATVTDIRLEADGSCFTGAPGGYLAGSWDRSDISYQRPLTVNGLPPEVPMPDFDAGSGPGRASLDDLWARRKIRDCVIRSVRGLDRNDRDLALRAFHSQALVTDGAPESGAADWIDGELASSAANDAAVTHNITTQLAAQSGDTATAETYLIVMRRRLAGTRVWVGGVRLLDQLDGRNGDWAITSRQIVADWEFEADGGLFNVDDGYLHGRRDRQDPWYQRA